MKKSLVAIGAVLMLTLASCSSPEASEQTPSPETESAEAQELNLVMSSFVPPKHYSGIAEQAFMDSLLEQSDGKITGEVIHSGGLLPAGEQVTGIGSSVSDLGLALTAYTPADFPVANWIGQLAFTPSAKPVVGDLQAAAATLEWSRNNDAILEEFERQNVYPLIPHMEFIANYALICSDEVSSLDQASGKIARVTGPAPAAEATAIGMEGTSLAPGEMYEALQRGVIDCAISPLRDMVDFGLIEVAKHVTVDPEISFTGTNVALVINLDTWNGFTDETKEMFQQAAQEFITTQISGAINSDITAIAELAEKGGTIHPMADDMREKLVAQQQSVLDSIVTEAPPAVADDAQAQVDSFLQTMEKWLATISESEEYGNLAGNWTDFVNSDTKWGEDVTIAPWGEMLSQNIFN